MHLPTSVGAIVRDEEQGEAAPRSGDNNERGFKGSTRRLIASRPSTRECEGHFEAIVLLQNRTYLRTAKTQCAALSPLGRPARRQRAIRPTRTVRCQRGDLGRQVSREPELQLVEHVPTRRCKQ